MYKGQRPSRHVRWVHTKKGIKPRLVNKGILKTDSKGYLKNLDVSLTTVPDEHPFVMPALPPITVKRLSEFGNGNTEDNATIIAELYSRANPSELNIPSREDILGGRERYYFIKAGDQLVGVGAIRMATGEIQKVFILPDFRGHKYGMAFVKKAEEILQRDGVSTAIMFVKQGNEGALHAWESMGYRRIGEYGENNSLKLEKYLGSREVPSDRDRQRIMTVI